MDNDDLFTFTAEPTHPDSDLTIQVNGPDGFAGLYAGSPAPGEPATAIIDGSIPGAYQIIVASDNESEITATLQFVEAEQIVPGNGPVQGVVPAVFDLDLVDGERRVVIVTPQGDQELRVEIRNPGRDEPTDLPGLGEPLVALLSGAGTHQIRVTGTELGEASFVIETAAGGRRAMIRASGGRVGAPRPGAGSRG